MDKEDKGSDRSGNLSISRILKGSWDIYRKNFAKIVVLIVGYVLVMTLFNVIVSMAFPMPQLPAWMVDPEYDVVGGEDFSPLFSLIGWVFMVALLSLIVSSLVYSYVFLGISYIAQAGFERQEVSLGIILSRSLSRWLAAVYTGFLENVFLFFLFLMLILPGVLYSVYWFFALYPVAFYGKSGRAALDYSKRLVQGRWWKVFSYIVSIGVLLAVPLVFVVIAFTLLRPFMGDMLTTILDSLITQMILTFYLVFCAVLFFALDESTEKETMLPDWYPTS